MSLPDSLSKKAIDEQVGDQDDLLEYWVGAMETLGVLVFHHEIDLDLVDDFFSGQIVVSWRKLSRWVEDFREETQRPTMAEWFEWLVDRMRERVSIEPPVPAYITHRDWLSSHGNTRHAAAPRNRPQQGVTRWLSR